MTPKFLAYLSIGMAIIVFLLTLGVIIFPKVFNKLDRRLIAGNINNTKKDRLAFWIDRSINWKSVALLYIVLSLLLLFSGQIKHLGVVSVSILSGSIGFWSLKRITQRKRPSDARVQYKDYSFPSGHTTTGVVILLTFAYLISFIIPEGWNLIFYALALAGGGFVGWSRRYLKAHRVSDVITAWLLGSGCFIFAYLLLLYFGDALLITLEQVFFSL